jgi:hypothetical protein
VREVAQRVPLDRLLVETDSPYLAPVPYRGKTNQPGYVKHVAEEVARLRGLSYEALSTPRRSQFLPSVPFRPFESCPMKILALLFALLLPALASAGAYEDMEEALISGNTPGPSS